MPVWSNEGHTRLIYFDGETREARFALQEDVMEREGFGPIARIVLDEVDPMANVVGKGMRGAAYGGDQRTATI